jgi:hypothetical protein
MHEKVVSSPSHAEVTGLRVPPSLATATPGGRRAGCSERSSEEGLAGLSRRHFLALVLMPAPGTGTED